jgi:hypothetical protein
MGSFSNKKRPAPIAGPKRERGNRFCCFVSATALLRYYGYCFWGQRTKKPSAQTMSWS